MTNAAIEFKYPLGIKAKCRTTGASGILFARIAEIHGMIQYGIQPAIKREGGIVPDALHVDEADVVTTSKTKPETVTFAFGLGEHVKSRFTGDEGHITRIVQFRNGCEKISMLTKLKDRDNKPVTLTVSLTELERLKSKDAKTPSPIKSGGQHTREKYIETFKK